jgi:hypothetical protein
MGDLLTALSSSPGGSSLLDWLQQLATMSSGQRLVEVGRVFFQFVGLWEFFKYVYRWTFKRRSGMELELEALEARINELNGRIKRLNAERERLVAELKSARNELAGAAIARAEHEFRDFNQSLAIGHLETWLADNAQSIAAIAKHLARYHITAAVPVPAQHLDRAADMLRLARGVSPSDHETREITSEFNAIRAGLQEQLLRGGDAQIGWNSAIARGAGEAMTSQVMLLRSLAGWCFARGMWRLTPLFADRAAELAEQGGAPIRRLWCQVETLAAFYQFAVGHSAEALSRVERVLVRASEFLPARDTATLDARAGRAQVLSSLGRNGEALAEIDAFAPFEAEVKGERHPDTLITRKLRAQVLSSLGRYSEALTEIDAFAPIQVEVQGERHPDTLSTRYLRAQVLSNLGRYGEALAEIDASAPIEAEVKSERHPDTLSARYLRSQVLGNLGRNGEALAEIDAFAPIQVEVLGVRHPDTLSTRYLRAQALSSLGRYGEAQAEIDAFAPIRVEVQGERHPATLTTRYLRADVLSSLGRYGEALAEIDAFAPIEADVKGEGRTASRHTEHAIPARRCAQQPRPIWRGAGGDQRLRADPD